MHTPYYILLFLLSNFHLYKHLKWMCGKNEIETFAVKRATEIFHAKEPVLYIVYKNEIIEK